MKLISIISTVLNAFLWIVNFHTNECLGWFCATMWSFTAVINSFKE